MPASLARGCGAALLACLLAACGRSTPPPPPHPPQTSGVLRVPGLRAPVTVLRDHWGIPHITAANDDDLFFAQGFVQAQDRLFQMDLWKRAAQGHLAEVLGANFIARDSMTRRIQFRGDYEQEWASYGPDTHRIAVAFTNGINAWVRHAREDLPEEFVAAGWPPEFWRPEDLLNRTDAFLASGNALDDLFRARLIASAGAARAHELFPLPGRQRAIPDPGVDLSAVTFVVSDAVRRIGTAPFFLTLGGKVSEAPRPTVAGANSGDVPSAAAAPGGAAQRDLSSSLGSGGRTWIVDAPSAATGAPLVGVSLQGRLSVPSARYLVHLTAPGWNVIGATSPWLPGVVVGHNDRVAWAMAPVAADTQDIFVERVNPADPHQVERDGRWVDMSVDRERVAVNSREQPVEYERLYTPNGVVIAQDAERHLVYTLRWSGTEPGGAGELAALALNRAGSVSELSGALAHWKMPVAEFVFGDIGGQVARQVAGLVPVRASGGGPLPASGWVSDRTWRGFENAGGRMDAMTSLGVGAVDDLQRVQTGVSSPGARTILALIDQIRSYPREVENLRAALLSWDGQFDGKSRQSELYLNVVAALRRSIVAESRLPDELSREVANHIDVVSLMSSAPVAWFGQRPRERREKLLVDALSIVAKESASTGRDGGESHLTLMLEHPLGIFDEARRRFNVGPVRWRGGVDTVFASDGRNGTVLRAVFDVADWNRSVVALAPGQSGSPSSPHYDDLASIWADAKSIPLTYAGLAATSSGVEQQVLQP